MSKLLSDERLEYLKSTRCECGHDTLCMVTVEFLDHIQALQSQLDEVKNDRDIIAGNYFKLLNEHDLTNAINYAFKDEISVARERLGPAGYKILDEVRLLRERVGKLRELADKISHPHPNPGTLSDVELICYWSEMAESAVAYDDLLQKNGEGG